MCRWVYIDQLQLLHIFVGHRRVIQAGWSNVQSYRLILEVSLAGQSSIIIRILHENMQNGYQVSPTITLTSTLHIIEWYFTEWDNFFRHVYFFSHMYNMYYYCALQLLISLFEIFHLLCPLFLKWYLLFGFQMYLQFFMHQHSLQNPFLLFMHQHSCICCLNSVFGTCFLCISTVVYVVWTLYLGHVFYASAQLYMLFELCIWNSN